MRLLGAALVLILAGCAGVGVSPEVTVRELELTGALVAALDSIPVDLETARFLVRDYQPPQLQKILHRVGEVVEWQDLEIPEEYSFPADVVEVREVWLSDSGNTATVSILMGPIIANHNLDCGYNYEIGLVKAVSGDWQEKETGLTVC